MVPSKAFLIQLQLCIDQINDQSTIKLCSMNRTYFMADVLAKSRCHACSYSPLSIRLRGSPVSAASVGDGHKATTRTPVKFT